MQVLNRDRAITNRDYKSDPPDTLRVTSVFPTIQGEGPYAGRASIFIRLSGCNFGDKNYFCAFCDSSFEFDNASILTYSELEQRILDIPEYHPNMVLVITGGEPTLQDNLIPFLVRVRHLFSVLQIETNGTQSSWFKKLDVVRELDDLKVIVSPKASYKAKKYPQTHSEVLARTTALKFVLEDVEGSPHNTIPDWAFDFRDEGHTVYVSPMAVYRRPYSGEVSSAWDHTLIDAEKTERNYNYAGRYALKHNLCVSIQGHLFLALA